MKAGLCADELHRRNNRRPTFAYVRTRCNVTQERCAGRGSLKHRRSRRLAVDGRRSDRRLWPQTPVDLVCETMAGSRVEQLPLSLIRKMSRRTLYTWEVRTVAFGDRRTQRRPCPRMSSGHLCQTTSRLFRWVRLRFNLV